MKNIFKVELHDDEEVEVCFGGYPETLVSMIITACEKDEDIKQVITQAAFIMSLEHMENIIKENKQAKNN